MVSLMEQDNLISNGLTIHTNCHYAVKLGITERYSLFYLISVKHSSGKCQILKGTIIHKICACRVHVLSAKVSITFNCKLSFKSMASVLDS